MAADVLLPVETARARILKGVRPLATERVGLDEALGRVLARSLRARRDQPPAHMSAMDGYAVRAEDILEVPKSLTIIGEAPAGRRCTKTVGPGEAVRIFTGALMPDGADTVVIQEETLREGVTVTVLEVPKCGQFVREAGLDFRKGEPVLAPGVRMASRSIGLAAAMNIAVLPVRRRPRVVIMPTGDELVPPGTRPRIDQIVSSNDHALAAYLRGLGAEPIHLGIVPDRMDAFDEAFAQLGNADILVTLGGASVGEHDLVRQALTARGMTLAFWKIAMRPGKPLMFGRLGDTRVLGLPGNPVSALVCARVFLKPLVDALLGLPTEESPQRAKLAIALGPNDRRQDYLRALLETEPDGTRTVTPFARQDSAMLRRLAEAGCLVVRPPFAPAAAAGTEVDILPLDF